MACLAKMDWATWVTILLAAIGVLIAALGVLFTIASVVLGALAVFGFRDLKSTVIDQAREAARDAAKKAVDDVIAGYPSRAEMIEEVYAKVAPQVTKQFASKFDISDSTQAPTTDAPATLGDTGSVAEIYPEELELPSTDVPPEHDSEGHDEN